MKVKDWAPEKITAEIEKKVMDRLESAAQRVAEKARSLVPVGKDVTGKGKWSKREAGALKNTIRVVRLKGDPKQNIRVYAGNRDVYYARFVEYGTVKMKAKPFMRPALNASKAEIKAIVGAE
ncbi:MAG: HK97-gp10 family putative phage morphogenesis protein [Syntrophorhabdaceae bacterium]